MYYTICRYYMLCILYIHYMYILYTIANITYPDPNCLHFITIKETQPVCTCYYAIYLYRVSIVHMYPGSSTYSLALH